MRIGEFYESEQNHPEEQQENQVSEFPWRQRLETAVQEEISDGVCGETEETDFKFVPKTILNQANRIKGICWPLLLATRIAVYESSFACNGESENDIKECSATKSNERTRKADIYTDSVVG